MKETILHIPFSVGDKVRIIKDHSAYPQLHLGKIATIDKITIHINKKQTRITYKIGSNNYYKSDLEEVK